MHAVEERTAVQLRCLVPVAGSDRAFELDHVTVDGAAWNRDLVAAGDENVVTQCAPQIVQRRRQSVTGFVASHFGPEQRQQLVARDGNARTRRQHGEYRESQLLRGASDRLVVFRNERETAQKSQCEHALNWLRAG